MLLEGGEENVAVLLARSTLPEQLDTDRHLETLLEFGLDRDHLDAVLRVTVGATTKPERDDLARTVSRRWSDLVDRWTSPR